ncbi:MAG: AAA family ATPase [Chitinophagales bacterium]
MSNANNDMKNMELRAKEFAQKVDALREEIGKSVVGQQEAVDGLLMSIFCDSHSLLVGVPGLAKTLLVQTLASVLELDFQRIQFTPDLMPSDITGAEILDESKAFRFNKGPIFSNIVLADEINRTPPKTQAALLEAMQERSVTIAGEQHLLPKPFFVLATQNPIEQEGTYPLPEAQLDRFMTQIEMTYPSFEEEKEVIRRTTGLSKPLLNVVLRKQELIDYQQFIRSMPITDAALEYAVRVVTLSRPNLPDSMDFVNQYVSWGAGPRAAQFIVLAAKCKAAMRGAFTPTIDDVSEVIPNVLRHRVFLNYKAEAEGVTLADVFSNIRG